MIWPWHTAADNQVPAMTSGETNLDVLLRAMRPALLATPFVFITVDPEEASALWPEALALIREAEGVTVVLPLDAAGRAGRAMEPLWAGITLAIHSSLNAVGFLAAISARLAAAGLSLNPLAGYHHDHLFVPWDRREEAMAVLASFAER